MYIARIFFVFGVWAAFRERSFEEVEVANAVVSHESHSIECRSGETKEPPEWMALLSYYHLRITPRLTSWFATYGDMSDNAT